MRECAPCANPVWPCAMSGAAAALAGFDDVGVIIHGSSGCLFYTSSLLEPAVYGTCIIESEAVFGTIDRLREVVEEVRTKYPRVAVINTCVPSVIGEDLAVLFGDNPPLILDTPGYLGGMEGGYHAALASLSVQADPESTGITIDGLNLIDPFYRGNLLETVRLLHLAGTFPAALLTGGNSSRLGHVAECTVTANPDCASGVGKRCGSLLGWEGVREAFSEIARYHPELDLTALENEARRTEERIHYACDKYLRRFDPPSVALFGGSAYAGFAADLLHRCLDAEILRVCSRNDPPQTPFPAETSVDLRRIGEVLTGTEPDLILGSDFEHSLRKEAAFVGITPPLRGQFRLRARAFAGLEGALSLIEEVLNTCRDRPGCRG